MAMADRDGLKLESVGWESWCVFSLPFCFNVPMEFFVVEKGQNNLAFAILLQIGDSTACVDLLTVLEGSFIRRNIHSKVYFYIYHLLFS